MTFDEWFNLTYPVLKDNTYTKALLKSAWEMGELSICEKLIGNQVVDSKGLGIFAHA